MLEGAYAKFAMVTWVAFVTGDDAGVCWPPPIIPPFMLPCPLVPIIPPMPDPPMGAPLIMPFDPQGVVPPCPIATAVPTPPRMTAAIISPAPIHASVRIRIYLAPVLFSRVLRAC